MALLRTATPGGVGPNVIELGPISPGECVPAPLHGSLATFVRLRRADLPYEWSREFDCRLPLSGARNAVDVKDVVCMCTGLNAMLFQAVVDYSDKSLTVTCAPYMTVQNQLPCRLQYSLESAATARDAGIVEQDSLVAGTTNTVVSLSPAMRPAILLKLDGTDWCARADLAAAATVGESTRRVVDLLSPPGDIVSLIIVVSIVNVVGAYGRAVQLNVRVFSRYLLVDRAELSLSVRCSRLAGSAAAATAACSDLAADWDEGEGLEGIDDFTPKQSVERKTYNAVPRGDGESSWIQGANGVALFHTDDPSTVQLGIGGGAAWSSFLSLAADSAKRSCEILDPAVGCLYQLTYRVAPLPGVFKTTRLVTVAPQYLLVNTLRETISVRQFMLKTVRDGSLAGGSTDLVLTASGPPKPSSGQCSCAFAKLSPHRIEKCTLRTAANAVTASAAEQQSVST